MYIHKLGKTTSGFGNRITKRGVGFRKGAGNHHRTLGSGIVEQLFTQDGTGRTSKASELLRSLKLSRPRLPKKYISLL